MEALLLIPSSERMPLLETCLLQLQGDSEATSKLIHAYEGILVYRLSLETAPQNSVINNLYREAVANV